MAAQEAMSRTRTAAISGGTRSRASRRADRLSASSPAEARVVALATSRPSRASNWSWGRSRRAAWYQRAAVAGARGAAARAASSSRATAWASPGRADRSTWWALTWGDAPCRSRTSAMRPWAVSRHPAPADS